MTTSDELREWIDIAASATSLAFEASGVICLRVSRAMLGGPNLHAEAIRMCSEKFVALAELQSSFIAGRLGKTPATATRRTLNHYSRKVAANKARLTRSEGRTR